MYSNAKCSLLSALCVSKVPQKQRLQFESFRGRVYGEDTVTIRHMVELIPRVLTRHL